MKSHQNLMCFTKVKKRLEDLSVNLEKDNCIDHDMSLFCKYSDVFDLTIEKQHQSGLNILHLNIRGLILHKPELMLLLNALSCKNIHVDILLLCETFINSMNEHKGKLKGYKEIHNFRKKMEKGGVAVFINKKFDYKIRHDLTIFDEGTFESQFVELTRYKGVSKSLIIGEMYRIPNTNEKIFLEYYQKILNVVKTEGKDIIIGTDQNLDLLKLDRHTTTKEFLEITLDNKLFPTVTKPSRIVKNSATCIDNIYVPEKFICKYKTTLILDDMSDHLPCLLQIVTTNQNTDELVPKVVERRSFTNESLQEIKLSLYQENWHELLQGNVDEKFNTFHNKLITILDKYAPVKKSIIPPDRVYKIPWMTARLFKHRSLCNRLHKKMLSDKNEQNIILYKTQRNLYNRLKNESRKSYFLNMFDRHRRNSKKCWELLNKIIGKTNNKEELPNKFDVNGTIIENPQKIANEFSNFYSQIGKRLADRIPKSKMKPMSAMGKRCENSMFLIPYLEFEIEDIIKTLPNKTSSGHDGLTNVLIKSICQFISTPLTIIINDSFERGEFPNFCKIAKVLPLYKAKEKHKIENYRPISLLVVLLKVIEKAMHKRLVSHLNRNRILYRSQYGFRKKH